MVLGKLVFHLGKIKLALYLTTLIKVNFRQIQGLKIKYKIIKGTIGECFKPCGRVGIKHNDVGK